MKILKMITIYLFTTIFVVWIVHNDTALYANPIGEIRHVENVKKNRVEDNFNNVDEQFRQKLQVRILNGKFKNQSVSIWNTYSKSQAMDFKYYVNQQVLLNLNSKNHIFKNANIIDLKRDDVIAGLLWTTILLLAWMGKVGLKSLLGLGINIMLFWLALLLDIHGMNVLMIFSFSIIIFSLVTLLMVLGWTRKMLVAFISTNVSVAIALLIGLIVFQIDGTGSIHFEGMEYVTQNPIPLFIAEIMVGSLGAIMDESTDITVSLAALYQESNQISSHNILRSGLNIGKSIMGSLINVLLMIFMADTFSIAVLLLRNGNNWGYTFMMTMTLGVIQTLISGIGIVVSIPITSWLSSVFLVKD